jgi:hypothetical protein
MVGMIRDKIKTGLKALLPPTIPELVAYQDENNLSHGAHLDS